jgi:hypothetical protein
MGSCSSKNINYINIKNNNELFWLKSSNGTKIKSIDYKKSDKINIYYNDTLLFKNITLSSNNLPDFSQYINNQTLKKDNNLYYFFIENLKLITINKNDTNSTIINKNIKKFSFSYRKALLYDNKTSIEFEFKNL